ncbi:MAG TPA: acyl-CoA dehydrogenase family protein [Acidimicrobiia bacterium]|nr:acyl-CoA dehydrogenase family protein [Acidimicrobiia bacterium]
MIDLADTTEEAAFRQELRAWLQDHAPGEPPPETLPERHRFLKAWHRRLHEGGWTGISWPTQYGGRGLGVIEESIFNVELGHAEAPAGPHFGYIGRPLLHYGTEEQKRRYLPPMLASEELWCQGFSEPDAGSDLAGLSTRAVESGERFVVSGQKVWTSFAQFADLCLLLARTDPTAPKHAGITALILDMHSPGVTVRPLAMSTGDAEFCEVFLDEVEVPKENVVGNVGQGWEIALTTLAYERGPVDIGFQARFERFLGRLVDEAARRGGKDDPAVRRTLASAAVAVEVLRLQCLRSLTTRIESAEPPGPEGSVDKLLMAATEQQLTKAALAILGPETLLADQSWFKAYLYARSASVYGGTREIQKNILASRVLQLPQG